MAATTTMARTLAQFGMPASVIGRMAATPPDDIAWLSASEIEMFPGGFVQRTTRVDFPGILAGYDSKPVQLQSQGLSFQDTGKALPLPLPPSSVMLPPPPHTAQLSRRAQQYADGMAYGNATSNPKCEGSKHWTEGCIAALDWKSKFYYSPDTRSVAQLAEAWLSGYDDAYQHKRPPGECGNGVDAYIDGCRVGAEGMATI